MFMGYYDFIFLCYMVSFTSRLVADYLHALVRQLDVAARADKHVRHRGAGAATRGGAVLQLNLDYGAARQRADAL